MGTAPRNLRTKQPRSVRARQLHVSQSIQRAYRYGAPITPTPPPVAVSVAPAGTASSSHAEVPLDVPADPAETTANGGASAWVWFALSALVCGLSAAGWRHWEPGDWLSSHLEPIKLAKQDPPTAALLQSPLPVAQPAKTPKWQVQHDGPVPIDGGVMLLPDSFSTKEGPVDVLIHFHGDAELVRQSVGLAKLNAAVAVINLGEGSKPYGAAFQQSGSFERLITQITTGLKQRGVKAPTVKRLALTSWGAGYGAIASILEHRRAPHADRDTLDALVTLDGIHCAYMDGDSRRLNERAIVPFLRAAESAANGQLLFSMTHSQLQPRGYAGSKRTAEVLLDNVGVQPSSGPTMRIPSYVKLPAAEGLQQKDVRLLPVHDTRVGTLRVQEFAGDSRDHHVAHLTQMATIALADLSERWSKEPRANVDEGQAAEAPADEAKVDTHAEASAESVAAKPGSAVKAPPAVNAAKVKKKSSPASAHAGKPASGQGD